MNNSVTPLIDPLAAVPPPIVPIEKKGFEAAREKLSLIRPSQYGAFFAIVGAVAVGTFFISNVARFSGDIRSSASGGNTPEPTPISCNAKCDTNSPCPSNLTCVDGACRNPSCWGSSTCICPKL